jgi:uracil-DNA glycosylase
MGDILWMEASEDMEALRRECELCNKCGSLGALTDRKVFGEGPINANIMSISEAPGKDEYEQGGPYRGKAGRFWEGMLTSVGWSRSHIYVCNAVKCRPMYGGVSNCLSPNLEDVDFCKNFLTRQVAIVRPRILLVFGKAAAYALGILTKKDYAKPIKNRLGIQKERYYHGSGYSNVLLTYHPSYLQNKPDGRAYCFQAYKQLYDAKKLLEAEAPWDG